MLTDYEMDRLIDIFPLFREEYQAGGMSRRDLGRKYGLRPYQVTNFISRIEPWRRKVALDPVQHLARIRSAVGQSSSTDVTGVSFNRQRGMWSAGIVIDYRKYHLGYYPEFMDAACARLAAEQCNNWPMPSKAYNYVCSTN